DIMLRSEIDDKYKWNLADIVKDETEWNNLYNEIELAIKEIAKFAGKLNNRDNILQCLNLNSNASQKLEKIYVYSKMKMDEDSSLAKFQALTDKAERILVDYSVCSSFITPEITKLSDEELSELINDKDFSNHSCYFESVIREKKHILSEEEEKLLSNMSSFTDNFKAAFNMFDNVDVDFGEVKFNGEKIKLTHGTYSMLLQSKDRKVRRAAYNNMFSAYKKMINTIASIYAGNVKKNCFFAKVRGYESSIEKAMFNENVPSVIYKNLTDSVDKNIKLLHDYLLLRKKELGYTKLAMWDMHTPIVDEVEHLYEYEVAVQIVKKALEPLGEDYAKLLDDAFADKWIDVYENQGKRSGAYSWGCYGVHPYVLLNYTCVTHDVFTIAHELGHAMHSYYSNASLPYEKAGYEIFVAEVASTVNEILLLKYMIEKAEGNEKKYLLSYYLDMFRTTLFRQTQFAEFEMICHNAYEQGEALTAEFL
ncbi:MAG: oligoendopeptidase F family protein, partial [Clostridia bacterium]|nr:oligoendopeptidase F family protein [Clostridia bacterium]